MKALAVLKRNKWVWLLLVIPLLLIPATAVLATYLLPTHNYIRMSGVNNSNLYIGLNGISHTQWWIGMDVQATYINPTSGVGSMIVLFPLIFIALAVIALVGYGLMNGFTPFTLIIMAIIIYIAIALLIGINGNIMGIIGGGLH